MSRASRWSNGVLDNLSPIHGIGTVYIVTNNKFAADFQAWADGYNARSPKVRFKIVNDQSTSDKDKLGAIGDIHLVVNQEHLDNDDLLVVAGDNLFSEPLSDFAEFTAGRDAVLATYDVESLEAIKKYNNLTLDPDGKILAFEEKPANPTGTITGIALYYFAKTTVPLFNTYIAEGNNPDQPGRFVQWLYPQMAVYTYPVKGTWFDIGSKETLDEANKIFEQFRK